MATVNPADLWKQADAEHPDDAPARRLRYLELMLDAGLIIPATPEDEQYTADNPPPWINRHRGGPG